MTALCALPVALRCDAPEPVALCSSRLARWPETLGRWCGGGGIWHDARPTCGAGRGLR